VTERAWGVVLACFLTAVFAWGFGFYAHGIYLVELRKVHGWSTSLISALVTGHYVVGALLLPWIGEAIGRFGSRAVFLAGLAILAISFGLLPVVQNPWQLAAILAVAAIGWNATSVAPIAATVGQWFERKRGLALNLALSGATVAGLAVAPLMLWGIEEAGFGITLPVMLGCGVAIAGGAVLAFVRRGPVPVASRARGQSRWAPLRSPGFWTVAGPFALVLAAQVGLLTHLVPLIADPDFRPAGDVAPSLALVITSATALVGGVGMGLVIDRLDPRRVSAGSFLLQVGAIAGLMVAATPLEVYLACGIYGLSVGNNITLAPLIIQREFEAGAFAATVAASTAVAQLAYAFGPGLLGILRDASGGYGLPLACCVAFNVAATALVFGRRSSPS